MDIICARLKVAEALAKELRHCEHDRTIVAIAVMGTAIALGKSLTGGETITARLIIGRMIVGLG